MRKINYGDVKNIIEYERVRKDFRKRIIELKRRRRVQVGDLISFLFENRETVLYQIQEMMRAERIVDEEKIRQEVDIYNELIPEDWQLSATMFIEITEQRRIKPILDSLAGIDRPGTVRLEIGDRVKVPADFEPGHSKEDKLSAVHYVRFRFTPEQAAALLSNSDHVYLLVEHPNYRAKAKVEPETVLEIFKDLQAA